MKYTTHLHLLFWFVLLFSTTGLFAQNTSNIQQPTSINADGSPPDASALLDVSSTDKGMLVPRMATAQRTAIASPATGLLVFDTDMGGFWFFDGSAWQDLSAGGGGDNLGNHQADQNLQLKGNWLNNDGDNEGMKITDDGFVGLGNIPINHPFQVGQLVGQDVLDQANESNSGVHFPIDGANSAAQSFQSQLDGAVNLVELYLSEGAGGPFDALLEIVDGASPSGTTVLASTIVSISGASGQWQAFNFGSPANVAIGQDYTLRLSKSGGSGDGEWFRHTSDPYANGQAHANSGSWGSFPSDDCQFRVYVEQVNLEQTDLAVQTDGLVRIRDYTMPPADGSAGQVLSTDGIGAAQWATFGKASLEDADMDTKIQTEESADEDILRFDLAGTEKWVMKNSSLEAHNSGESVFIGEGAGINDDLSTNKNVAIGHEALKTTTNGERNTIVGHQAMTNGSSGSDNTAIGHQVLAANAGSNQNTAVGSNALASNTQGDLNTAIGYNALTNNTSNFANNNTAVGANALKTNGTAHSNTAVGVNAMLDNTNGIYNTALGINALPNNTTGNNNTAMGNTSMNNSTTGSNNTAGGNEAMHNNTTGGSNTALGNSALRGNTTGSNNTAIGNGAMANFVTTGGENTAVGTGAMSYGPEGSRNTAVGERALQQIGDGSYNTALGGGALQEHSDGDYNIGIGYGAAAKSKFGSHNIAIGRDALRESRNVDQSNLIGIGENALKNNGTGATGVEATKNTAVGSNALPQNTKGHSNTAIGFETLNGNSTGNSNTAVGNRALNKSTIQSGLVAVGDSALYYNGTGASNSYEATKNTAVGSKTLFSNTRGYFNTANGMEAMYSNTTGRGNTANGMEAMYSNTTGYDNTANGREAMYSNTTGYFNTANGSWAMYSNTTGHDNTANGKEAMHSNTTGDYNIANGSWAMYSNTTGKRNTAIGISASYNNTTGNQNTAIGNLALFRNRTGFSNVAIGTYALKGESFGAFPTQSNLVAVGDSTLLVNGLDATESYHATKNMAIGSKAMRSNTIGWENTALGFEALFSNTSGAFNTASGKNAMHNNTTGDWNTANGGSAMNENTTGHRNTAVGNWALGYNTAGASNTAVGFEAMKATQGDGNTAVGREALINNTTGVNRTAVGINANYLNAALNNNTAIGANATCGASDQVRVGDSSVNSIGGYADWTNVSDQRFKQNVKENVQGLEFIKALRPVTYTLDQKAIERFLGETQGKKDTTYWPTKYDASKQVRTGFLAQEVEAVAESLGYDFSGIDTPKSNTDFYGLRYATFTVPLVKAVQELNATDEALKAELSVLKNENQVLRKKLEYLETTILQLAKSK